MSREVSDQNIVAIRFERVQVVGPSLHHFFALLEVGSPVVCPAVGVLKGVRQLLLKPVRPHIKLFIEDGSGHSAKTVTTHLVLTYSHAAHGRKYSVVAHRAMCRTCAGKDVFTTAGEWL